MEVLRALRKLLLGETWILPLGLAVVVGLIAFAVKPVLDDWRTAGGFVLLGGVLAVLVASVAGGTRRRRA